jgi:hypothetical protein
MQRSQGHQQRQMRPGQPGRAAHSRFLKQPQTPKEQLVAMSVEDLAALCARLSAQLPGNGA